MEEGGDWGDVSVAKVFAAQSQGPHLKLKEPTYKLDVIVSSTLSAKWKQKQETPQKLPD